MHLNSRTNYLVCDFIQPFPLNHLFSLCALRVLCGKFALLAHDQGHHALLRVQTVGRFFDDH